jgi:uncharacterized membrane protein
LTNKYLLIKINKNIQHNYQIEIKDNPLFQFLSLKNISGNEINLDLDKEINQKKKKELCL